MKPADDHDPGAALGHGCDAGARQQWSWSLAQDGLLRRRCFAAPGLAEKYGKSRVFDSPISEGGIIGAAVGMGRMAAAGGGNPVRRLRLSGIDQIVFREAARLRFRSVNDFTCPMVIRMPCGGGIYGGQTHSQSPGGDVHPQVCGIRTVMPSTVRREGPADRLDRERRPVVSWGQAPLQRPVRRSPDKPVVPWSKHQRASARATTVPLDSAAIVQPG